MTICTWTRWPAVVERNLKGVAGLSEPSGGHRPVDRTAGIEPVIDPHRHQAVQLAPDEETPATDTQVPITIVVNTVKSPKD